MFFGNAKEEMVKILKIVLGDRVHDKSLSVMLKTQSKPLLYLLAVDTMHPIASGMCYLYDMHVAHLDLKPDNVLMRPNSINKIPLNSSRFLVKLADYGTTKIEVQSKVLKKQNCDHLGTTRYMAPKIIQQDLGSHTSLFHVDVWYFAMTCSEILAQTTPYESIPMQSKDILKK